MIVASTCSGCGIALADDSFGGHCVPCLLQLGLEDWTDDLMAVDRIDGYALGERIGEGGCGVVFEAEQLEPIRRKVALKVIKPGMDTRQVIARFDAERQALALLDHPYIAKVFDAGTTELGRPYFAMELVRGEKITDHCNDQKLSIRERIELFAKICTAVQHAHQKGIIHRDLKPSNILVADDLPKIIDFGIAKSIEQPLTDMTLMTAVQQFMGTPAYMSPEQAGARGVDTRSDVYSLGVLLYELLTGLTPFDAEKLRELPADELLRFIREIEPVRPSTRLNEITSDQFRGHSDSSRLLQSLRGDLDWIVMKCLEKDPARRYESAAALALDLQRHLQNEPVSARPPSQAYRFAKFVRRNRLTVGAAAVVGIALILATVISTYQAVQANRAQREQAQISACLKDILAGAQPAVALGRDTSMLSEILDRAAVRINRDLANQPVAQAELLGTLADTYHEFGEYQKMETVAREALQLSRPRPGVENLAVAKSLLQLGDASMHLGNLTDAENLAREALAMRKKFLGNEHPEVSEALNNLALVLREQKRFVEAEELSREALVMDRKLLGSDHPKIAADLGNLGAILWSQDKRADAESAYREALALRRKILGNEHPDIAISLNNLATVLLSEKKFPEAESASREALALDRKFLGPDHPDHLLAWRNLTNAIVAQGSLIDSDLTILTIQEWGAPTNSQTHVFK